MKRSNQNWYIGGVCGGIAESTNTSAIAWRILFILVPYSFWIYMTLWILLKDNNETKYN